MYFVFVLHRDPRAVKKLQSALCTHLFCFLSGEAYAVGVRRGAITCPLHRVSRPRARMPLPAS